MQRKQIKTVIFDWDGTLHDTIHIYEPAFKKAMAYLVDEGLIHSKEWKTEDIKPFIGMSPTAMWATFKPALSKDVIEVASSIISKTMQSLIEDHQGRLYSDVIETLTYLKHKGYYLVYLSNSKTYYMELMKSHFDLTRFFDRFVCSETHNYLPKQQILTEIKEELPQGMAMVGDRIIDIETGKLNGCLTFACDYGYGPANELKDADIHLSDLTKLKDYL
jgi:phosphoglycolate phosphatase